jgi:hypothetical protein
MAKIEEDRKKIELCKLAPHEPEEVKELAHQNLEKYLRGYDGREARVHHVIGFCLHYKLYFNYVIVRKRPIGDNAKRAPIKFHWDSQVQSALLNLLHFLFWLVPAALF